MPKQVNLIELTRMSVCCGFSIGIGKLREQMRSIRSHTIWYFGKKLRAKRSRGHLKPMSSMETGTRFSYTSIRKGSKTRNRSLVLPMLVEFHKDIVIDQEYDKKDFDYQIPEGAVLRDSLFW